ncbi:hypothetical protein CROQUDRAFT_92435 [Cronartium quercuum f. sp. fusiforme G11]|uniref:Uncharacterized protein n=1 Tax=Cronartium quercuum f. sp. fusiforme G11 TaxID=708437 RepID=A0A9P6TCC8_9BASI|nr:hypothetical protein CROQUDRAFT_92435 [Cronartium quercuum f. sp. fusiforme G11]
MALCVSGIYAAIQAAREAVEITIPAATKAVEITIPVATKAVEITIPAATEAVEMTAVDVDGLIKQLEALKSKNNNDPWDATMIQGYINVANVAYDELKKLPPSASIIVRHTFIEQT